MNLHLIFLHTKMRLLNILDSYRSRSCDDLTTWRSHCVCVCVCVCQRWPVLSCLLSLPWQPSCSLLSSSSTSASVADYIVISSSSSSSSSVAVMTQRWRQLNSFTATVSLHPCLVILLHLLVLPPSPPLLLLTATTTSQLTSAAQPLTTTTNHCPTSASQTPMITTRTLTPISSQSPTAAEHYTAVLQARLLRCSTQGDCADIARCDTASNVIVSTGVDLS